MSKFLLVLVALSSASAFASTQVLMVKSAFQSRSDCSEFARNTSGAGVYGNGEYEAAKSAKLLVEKQCTDLGGIAASTRCDEVSKDASTFNWTHSGACATLCTFQ